ncbi:hypothetical protein [Peteryoungia ipomoeae]|uniref:Uncharacterized protein n=1 Tax=Peteryoungia ipomoeae TaxID=1210932 RepID=A0A4S8NZ71_9HYPH|nr:hypothetical protein [Peteryoungia ipomoeae]THV23027.1 hypothetical protein FAA97_10390 [Peteryoungia ipomoeae]
MQVPCSHGTSSSYSKPAKAQDCAGGFSEAVGTAARADLEKMLDNLCQDPSIAKRVSEDEEGRYSFDIKGQNWSEKSFAARALVLELNDQDFSLIGNEGFVYPSDADRSLFKQMTGYNMLILGGTCVVLDNEGFPPAAADKSSVQQAFDFFQDVACHRQAGYLEGELSAEKIGAFLAARNLGPGSRPFIDHLLQTLNVSSGDLLGFSEAAALSQEDQLLALVEQLDNQDRAALAN